MDRSIQQYIIDRTLSEGHGKALASLPLAQQLTLAKQCIQHQWSVRKIEQAVKKSATAPPISTGKDPNLVYLERQLSDHLGSKAQIDFEQRKGQITIDFANLDVLEGLLKKMGYAETD